jgi:lipoprotein-anchoring transpeptidase ErfK/SrfK
LSGRTRLAGSRDPHSPPWRAEGEKSEREEKFEKPELALPASVVRLTPDQELGAMPSLRRSPHLRALALSVLCGFACSLGTVAVNAQSISPHGVWDEYDARSPQRGYSVPAPSEPALFGFGGSTYGAYATATPDAVWGTYSNTPYWTPVDPSQPMVADGGPRPAIAAVAPQLVAFNGPYEPGTVLIDTTARRLYYVNAKHTAFAYPVGVGRDGFTWSGTEAISRIADWPDWYPPAEMRERKPGLPEKMVGGVLNPLGAKALYLGNSLYRIHGTDAPKTVGTAQSSGCIRMLNENVVHLASLVHVGTKVIVAPSVVMASSTPTAPAEW